MREIKFRAWDKKEKKMHGYWLMGFFSVLKDWLGHPNLCFGQRVIGNPTEENIIHNIDEQRQMRKRFIVMQYTGLKDKNDKEIYEGDILPMSKGYAVVEFKYGMFYLANNSLNHYVSDQTKEVIGNIYENPKLLGGDKK